MIGICSRKIRYAFSYQLFWFLLAVKTQVLPLSRTSSDSGLHVVPSSVGLPEVGSSTCLDLQALDVQETRKMKDDSKIHHIDDDFLCKSRKKVFSSVYLSNVWKLNFSAMTSVLVLVHKSPAWLPKSLIIRSLKPNFLAKLLLLLTANNCIIC